MCHTLPRDLVVHPSAHALVIICSTGVARNFILGNTMLVNMIYYRKLTFSAMSWSPSCSWNNLHKSGLWGINLFTAPYLHPLSAHSLNLYSNLWTRQFHRFWTCQLELSTSISVHVHYLDNSAINWKRICSARSTRPRYRDYSGHKILKWNAVTLHKYTGKGSSNNTWLVNRSRENTHKQLTHTSQIWSDIGPQHMWQWPGYSKSKNI